MWWFRGAREGAVLHSGGRGPRAQPLLAILPVLEKPRQLRGAVPRTRHAGWGWVGGTERLHVLPGWLEKKGASGEFRGVLGDCGGQAVAVWPLLTQGIKRETTTASCQPDQEPCGHPVSSVSQAGVC